MTPNDVKIVAENIDDFIEVPDGINRLRKAVLTLAVSGKLVPQDGHEGTAEELYAEIQARQAMFEDVMGRRSKKKSLAPTSYKEILFDLPKSWKWARIGDVCNLQTGATPSRNNVAYFGGDIPWLVSGDINRGEILECEGRITKAGLDNSNCKIIQPNSVLIALNGQGKTRATVAILRIPAALNQSLVAMTPFSGGLLPEYIFWYLRSRYREMRAITGQDDRRGLNMRLVGELAIPLPPTEEQNRVVKRVQQIMEQLDELEAKKRERDEVRTRLARSTMQSLGKGESKIAFDHLAELVRTPADLKELEGALLTLAVSGKLMPQDTKDGTSEELYKQIRSSIKSGGEGREKKTVGPATISAEEVPFEIPKSWEWVRLAEIGKLDTGKTPRTGVTGNYSGDIPFIGPGDVQNGKINSYSKLITKQGATESKYLYPGDVLMVCIGGTIGKTALVNGTHTFNQQINKITPCLVDSTFLFCVFQSSYFQKLVWSKASGGATPLVNLTRWSSCIVPLPPLAEQKRIVKKVEEVTVLINRLKQVIGEK